jgi:hypothetical protein
VVAVFGEAGVIHRPGDRVKGIHQAFGQPAADRPPVPRRHGHKVVQRLVVDLTEPGRHRLDRLTPPVQHQPPQITLATGTLVLAR